MDKFRVPQQRRVPSQAYQRTHLLGEFRIPRQPGPVEPARLVILADGSESADQKLARVLWNDPATGVMRHADAGYEEAIDCARTHGLNLPSIGK